MFKTVFLLVIILTAVIFTPVVFGQDLKKATWLERASVIYDQKFSESVTSSVVFETLNNNEIQFPNPLLKEISSYEEAKFAISCSYYSPKGERGLSPYTSAFDYNHENSEIKKNEFVSKMIAFINSDKKRPISVPENIK